MAHFNPNQHRDSRGRFTKHPDGLFTRAFHSFRGFTKRRTFKPGQEQGADYKARQNAPKEAPAEQIRRAADPETARQNYIAAIRDEIKRLADWIEPDETGKFPRTVIKHLRRLIAQYEAVIKIQPDEWTAVLAKPHVKITGTAPEMLAFLDLLEKAQPQRK